MKHIYKLLTLLLLLFPSFGFAEVKEIICEGTYNMGDGETPTVAESRALLNAKRVAVEQAGTYIESYSRVKNFQLTQDEIQVLASGLMEVTILDKKRTVVGDGINFWVKIKAKVSPDKAEEMAKRLKEKPFADQYKRLQNDYESLTKDMEILKKQLKEAQSEKQKREVEAKVAEQERLFKANEWLEKGEKHFFKSELDDAREAFNRSISLNPNNPSAYKGRVLTYSYASASEIDNIIRDLTKVIALDPNDPEAYWGRGDAYVMALKFSLAFNDYEKEKALKPWSQVRYELLGHLLKEMGSRNYSIQDFTKAISLNPKYPFAYLGLASVYQEKGEYDKAIEALTKGISLCPVASLSEESLRALLCIYPYRAFIYELKGQIDKALKDYDMVLAISDNPEDSGDAYQKRAEIYLGTGKLDKAIDEQTKAIAELSKTTDLLLNHASEYYFRAGLYFYKGLYAKAIKDYDKVIKLNPHYFVYYDRGTAYHALGDYRQAIKDYDKAIELDSKHKSAYFSRGNAYGNLGDHRQAIKDYDKAIELNPKYEEAYYNRGLIYINLGNNQQATEDIKAAARLGLKEAQDLLKREGIGW